MSHAQIEDKWHLAEDRLPLGRIECWVVTRERPDLVGKARYMPGYYGSPWRQHQASEYEYPGEVTQWRPLMVPEPPNNLLTEVERLRAENASLKRLLDDANERAAQIEDWQIKCALLEVDRDRLREAVKTAMDFIDGRAPFTANEVGAQLEDAYEPYAPKKGTDAD